VGIWILYYYIVDLDEAGVIFSELMHRGQPRKHCYRFKTSKPLQLSYSYISTSAGEGRHTYLRGGGPDSGFGNADAEQDIWILSTSSDESAHAAIFSQILDEIISVVYQAFSTSSCVPVMASELATRATSVTRNGCHASSSCSAQETPAGKDKRRNQDEV